MKITVFTSNHPRHAALITALAEVGEVCAVQECTTVFQGVVQDVLYRQSDVMTSYFNNVAAAEREVFGDTHLTPRGVRTMAIKMGDLSRFPMSSLAPVLGADMYIVFGSSFIKGELCDFLVDHKAVNIHMGTSPYYRGAACNFWALYDRHPEYVGATIHLLSRGLDSGDMLFHALPKAEAVDPFVLGMRAVQAAHIGLVAHLRAGDLARLEPVKQDKAKELRYSRVAEFTDEVAAAYLAHAPSPAAIGKALKNRDTSLFLRPHIA